MKIPRKLLLLLLLVLWGASAALAWSPITSHFWGGNAAHAQGTTFNATATVRSGTTIVDVKITQKPADAAYFNYERQVGSIKTAISSGTNTDLSDSHGPQGTFNYVVSAYKSTANFRANQVLASAPTNSVTLGSPGPNAGGGDSPLDVTVTVSGDTVNLSWRPLTGTQHYEIWRAPQGGSFTQIATTVDGTTTTKTDTPGNGTFLYRINAGTTVGTESGPVTVPSSSTAPPAAGTTGPLGATCGEAESGARAAAASSKTITSQGIFEVISQDGVKSVFRWVLSLVNFVVLLFLLAVAFASILRWNVDTYAIQKVFMPLILGVLMANFSWLICRFFIELSTILYHALTDPYGGGVGLFKAIAIDGYGLGNLCNTANGTAFASGLLGVFVGTVLIIIAGILILTLYILLVARVWIVTLLIILAPLAFLCLGFTPTQQFFKRWWGMFFNWVFMAPASFLILVLAYQMTRIGSGPNLTKFIIITALLYYAIQVPFKMGGDWMTKWGSAVSSFKRKAGEPVANFAKERYENQKALLKLRGKELATRDLQIRGKNINPIGGVAKRFAAGGDKREVIAKDLQERLDTRLTDAKTDWRKTEQGKRYLGKGGMTEREKERAENELKTAQGHAVIHALNEDEKRSKELDDAHKPNTTLAARLAKARLEHALDEQELKRYDIRIEGEERGRVIAQDPDVVNRQKRLAEEKDRQKAAMAALDKSNPRYQKVKQKRDQVADEVKNLEKDIEGIKAAELKTLEGNSKYRSADKYAKEEMLDAAVKAAAGTKLDDLKNKQTYLNKINKLAKRFSRNVDEQVAQAEIAVRDARVKAAEKSYEAREAVISVDDAVRENTSENTALFSQSTLGEWVNARRARWRTFIATNEKVDEENLERAFYIMFQGTPEEKTQFALRMAEKLAQNRSGEYQESMNQLMADMTKYKVKKPQDLPNYATDHKSFVDNVLQPQMVAIEGANKDHFVSQVYATRAKELTAAEVKKGQNIVLEEMIAPQRVFERIEETEAKIAHATNRLESLAKSWPEQEKAFKKAEADLAARKAAGTKILPEETKDLELRRQELKTSEEMLSVLRTDKVTQQQKLDLYRSDQKYLVKSMKEQYNGVLESMPRHVRDQFKVVNGEWDVAPPAQRRQYDRLKGMLGSTLREKASNRAKNRSVPDIIRELNGIGNDVFDKELIDAVFRGDIKYLTDTSQKRGIRRVEKAASFIFAALDKGRNWEEGTDVREYLINRLDAKTAKGPDAMEQLVVELAKNQSLASARSPRAKLVYQFLVKTAKGMEATGGKFAANPQEREEILNEVRQQLLAVNTDRVLSRQFIATLEKVIGPIEKV